MSCLERIDAGSTSCPLIQLIPSVCDCGYDNETVEYFILHCPKYDSKRSQLIDTVESLWHDVKVDGFAFDKLHLVAHRTKRDDTVTIFRDKLIFYGSRSEAQ